jgi:ABC-type transport system substrate-binding protein
MPEATTRLAALRTGQIDWIEVPPPDAIPVLRQAGFQITVRPYPHNWTHTLNLSRPPWDNKLVRHAANYAVDREGICKSLLNDTCIPHQESTPATLVRPKCAMVTQPKRGAETGGLMAGTSA